MVRYVRAEGVEAAPMLDETILYNATAQRFCVLNPTAAFVWESLSRPVTAEHLAVALRETFDVDGSQDVDADVLTTLRELEALELVTQLRDV